MVADHHLDLDEHCVSGDDDEGHDDDRGVEDDDGYGGGNRDCKELICISIVRPHAS